MTIEVFKQKIYDLELESKKQSSTNKKLIDDLCKKFIEKNKKFSIDDLVLDGKTLHVVKDIRVCDTTIKYYCCECELIDSIVYEYDYLTEFVDKQLVLKKGV